MSVYSIKPGATSTLSTVQQLLGREMLLSPLHTFDIPVKKKKMASPPSLFGQASSFSSNLVLLEPLETNAWWSNFQLQLIRATRKLSVVERQRAHHDLLGVQRFSFVDDSRERIAISLRMMTAELNSIKDKPAYDKAIAINKQYVTDDTFRTRFLRAQLFNPQEAAKKMVSYFETKLDLFGEEKLTKDLKYGDLSIEARAELEGGSSEGTSLQILPSCDLLQGRKVVLVIPSTNWKDSAVVRTNVVCLF